MTDNKNHYARVIPAQQKYQVHLQEQMILESDQALELHEHYNGKDMAAVVYFPSIAALPVTPTEHSSFCPIKGEASYWSYGDINNAIWSYVDPIADVAAIKGYYGFMQSSGFEIKPVD